MGDDDPVTEVTIEEVKQISAGMESSDGQSDEDGVIYELNDALETMIFRWEKCVEMNPAAASGDTYYLRRDEIVKKGQNFFHNFKRRKKNK